MTRGVKEREDDGASGPVLDLREVGTGPGSFKMLSIPLTKAPFT